MHTSARSAFLHCSRTTSLTSRTAVYGPVRTVVWQGSAGDCRPYADLVAFSSSCGVNNSPKFDAKSVVYRYSQALLAAYVAFVVCTETCPRRNWICSSSPPESWQSRAQDLRRSWGARRGMCF